MKSLVAISNWLVLLLYAFTCFDCQTDTQSHSVSPSADILRENALSIDSLSQGWKAV